jgi:ferredoxin-NADP reductase/DMSO/TMAO reductase YedYZ heme-binding membrane subunit
MVRFMGHHVPVAIDSLRRHRPAPTPKSWAATAFATLAGAGLVAALVAVLKGESPLAALVPGGKLIVLGRLAGFTGAYLILVMLLLIARLPWLERSVGQERLVWWHQRIAPWALWLIVAHVTFITLGYAQASKFGPVRQLWVFITSYPDLLAAIVGFCLLMMAGITSIRSIRRRLRYETWWAVHLYFYLGLALAFTHQIVTGVTFVDHPVIRWIWGVAWAGALGTVLAYRVGLPAARTLRHGLRVYEVRAEGPGVFSIICRGRHLDRLSVDGGQFFLWRFLARDLWWQAHPYSLSSLPRPPYIRVTIKVVGDQSEAVARLRPGTRIAIEGPYGAFTHGPRSPDRVALIGAGIGVTPIRALLEDLPTSVDVIVVTRASTADDLVLRREIADMVRQRGGQHHEITGPRHKVRLDARTLRGIVPDIAARDLYVCGPAGFTDGIVAAAAKLGVAADQIHREAFEF